MEQIRIALISVVLSVGTTFIGLGYWSGMLNAKNDMSNTLLNELSTKMDKNNDYLRKELKEIRAELGKVQTATAVNSALLKGNHRGRES